jgi:MOSC domain-containing protein YiiM
VNLEGDDQADREVHGGPDKAIYAYALEDIAWWEEELGRALGPAAFGENLTTSGVDVTRALVGERWEIGTALLEVSEPRAPCWKLGAKMGDLAFPKRFTKAGRPGAYLRIAREGILAAGDEIRIVSRPEHGVSVGDVFRIYAKERGRASLLLSIPGLSEDWKSWARSQLER